MCGICGYWMDRQLEISHKETVLHMADAIALRGPDSSGSVVFPQNGPVFAHCRLAIIDTSDAGLQPMASASGRFTIVYNGETYNHLDLRAELESEGVAPTWRGHSDTETILACCETWGIEKTVAQMTGMFALAIWENEARTLTLARDRLGEKPLYFGVLNNTFVFGSELKALRRHPNFHATIDRDALTALVQRSYVPSPLSIYSEIKKLQPGHLLTITQDEDQDEGLKIVLSQYWSLNEKIKQGLSSPFVGSENNAVKNLRSLLTEVVESQMLSDVPLGAFLSGGIDSSLVTAIMQDVSSHPVRTFSIGFDDKQFDESESARTMAERIGTDHVELIVTPEHLIDLIPQLPDIYCEPFSDSSQLPTYVVSQLARKHVKVVLTGDGADEIFGGYNRYMAAGSVWKHASRVPSPIRGAAGNAILSVSKGSWDKLFKAVSPVLPKHLQARVPGEKLHKIGRLLKQHSKYSYFESLISMTDDPASLVIGGHVPRTVINDSTAQPETDNFEHWMMAMDAQSYLPDDICVKVDRASMANSLETRTPFLDRRVVEFAWTLPYNFKIKDRQSKWILREILAGYVPRELFDRPKMGFGVPFGKWLRGPLHNWAEDLLRRDRLRENGFFDTEKVRDLWAAHQSGRGNHEYLLWNILMFNSWLERWGK